MPSFIPGNWPNHNVKAPPSVKEGLEVVHRTASVAMGELSAAITKGSITKRQLQDMHHRFRYAELTMMNLLGRIQG